MRGVNTFLLSVALVLSATAVEAAVLRVPEDAATLQGAVAIANAGDTIEVGAGRWCGALVTTRLNLVGHDDAVIVGVKDGQTCGPTIGDTTTTYRVGFHLSTSAASGTTVRGFRFDGSEIASDPSALAVAVYADATGGKVNDVRIEHNKVLGTFYAFKNEGGDRWVIRDNHIRGLTSRNGVGGSGIVVIQSGALRPQGTSIVHNKVRGIAPASLSSDQWFAAVTVAGAMDTEVSRNDFRVAAPDGQTSPLGVGVLVTTGPGSGRQSPRRGLPGAGSLVVGGGTGSQNTTVTMNKGNRSDCVLVVAGTGGTNTAGLVMRANLGRVLVEGEEVQGLKRPDSGDRDDDD